MKRFPAYRAKLIALLGLGTAGVVIGASLLMHTGPNLPDMVRIDNVGGAALYVQTDEVTVTEWNRCYDDGACDFRLLHPTGDTTKNYPATGLSYPDTQRYITWLNAATGHEFRLPTTLEWRTLAVEVMPETPDPIFTDPDLRWASAYLTEGQISRRLKPTGSYATTSDGVRDMDGNVWEWTQDCYAGSAGAVSADRCAAFYVQGIHEAVVPFQVRDPARGGCAVGTPPAHLGFRLVSDSALPAKG